MLQLNTSTYTAYKFVNSLFLGVSVGAVFTLYESLAPSVFSLGGILLALGMLLVARAYKTILNIVWFWRISLGVELVILLAVGYFLLFSYSYTTALLVYIGYQLTFVFGSYLVRAETLLLKTNALLTQVDSAKQMGYLVGMLVSFAFYKLLTLQDIQDAKAQVYALHYLLLGIEVVTIYLLVQSFKDEASDG